MDLLTLDSNVILDYSRPDPTWRPDVERLLDLRDSGEVHLMVTFFIGRDINVPRLDELPMLKVSQGPGLLILDDPILGRTDRLEAPLGDECLVQLERRLVAVAKATGSRTPPQHMDWLHLNAHKVQQRDHFLTRDGGMLAYADEIAGSGVSVMSPSGYLTLRSDAGDDEAGDDE